MALRGKRVRVLLPVLVPILTLLIGLWAGRFLVEGGWRSGSGMLGLGGGGGTSQSRPKLRGTPPSPPMAQRVLIISIDGCRPDLLIRADCPVIRGLLPSASYTFWARTVPDPYVATLPSHVSMLTGALPQRHGITWNDARAGYPKVPTLFELAHQAGFTTALVNGKKKFAALTKPGTLDWSYLPPTELLTDAQVAAEAVKILREHRPQVLFVHLPGVDRAGHVSLWGSPQQQVALEQADAAVGTIMTTLHDLELESTTLRIITADHGGAGGTHGGDDPRSRTIPWIAIGPGVCRNADLTRYYGLAIDTTDTFATACGALGIAIPADCDGRFVTEILDQPELLRKIP